VDNADRFFTSVLGFISLEGDRSQSFRWNENPEEWYRFSILQDAADIKTAVNTRVLMLIL
jgi:hypothetical protein